MRKKLIAGVAIVLVGSIGYGLRFDYSTFHGATIRVNRFTGTTEVLKPGHGWRPISTTPTAAPAPLTERERAHLDHGTR